METTTTKTTTVRRDWLRKQMLAGKLQAKCVFEIEHDGNGSNDRFGGDWLDARIRHPRFEDFTNVYGNKETRCADPDFIEGMSNFNESDFRTKSGHATFSGTDPEGRKLYSFGIHSNSCYRLREKVASV
jgi:hypothetical protein